MVWDFVVIVETKSIRTGEIMDSVGCGGDMDGTDLEDASNY